MSQVSDLGGGNLWVSMSGHKSTRENRCPPCGACLAGFLSLLRSLMHLIFHTHRLRGGLHSFAASRLGSRAASFFSARHSYDTVPCRLVAAFSVTTQDTHCLVQ